jgi:hypothetical protein
MHRIVSIIGCLLVFGSVALGQNRPQEPVEPYPYEAIDVTIPVGDAEAQTHTLAGTITLPDPDVFGSGPFVGVVLITGSGAQNRDEEAMGHKPFLILSDYLTKKGIAVLRYDDRGVGESTGAFNGATTVDFADDGQAAAHFLMNHQQIDPNRVGRLRSSFSSREQVFLVVSSFSIRSELCISAEEIPRSTPRGPLNAAEHSLLALQLIKMRNH